jgi:hypothetical protein
VGNGYQSGWAFQLGKRLPNAKSIVNLLYSKQVVPVSDVIINLGSTKQTENTLINDFNNLHILKEQKGYLYLQVI